MKAPDESGINKDCTEKSTDWIATDVKRCTDVLRLKKIRGRRGSLDISYKAPKKWRPVAANLSL